MTTTFQTKADVINELRNQIYYGQLEIERLLYNPSTLSHEKVVKKIISKLKENLLSSEAINLIESYIPNPQQTSSVQNGHIDNEETNKN